MSVPELRITAANSAPVNADGKYVLYWMNAARRTTWNFGLQRAVELAKNWRKPVVILEALRCDYPWACDRFHQFVVDGMADNSRRLRKRNILYYPYLEPQPDAGKGLLENLAESACAVITDDFPCFFLPRMVAAVSRRLKVRLEKIDSNGILPLDATDRVFARAHDFRRFLQKHLRPHLEQIPLPDPLKGVRLPKPPQLPTSITKRWPAADVERLAERDQFLAAFPIDHSVGVTSRGGVRAAEAALRNFRTKKLPFYEERRNHPDEDGTSGLSPYLHFGHISVHQVFSQLMDDEEWSVRDLSEATTGSSSGWWGVSPALESFLDELITWREVGYNMCRLRDDYDRYESLPDWARRTLADHADDPREHVYSLEQFEAAETHDELWNAAQRQLVREGRLHNYLRMLWGKKILEWSDSPQAAAEIMIQLNNKYALDGRNPNSYSGIFWVLGRYDRAWGPERPIFGKIRYMSSENTARKLRVKQYLQRYGA